MIKNLVKTHSDGTVSLTNICQVAGLGGAVRKDGSHRDGTFEYYVSEPVVAAVFRRVTDRFETGVVAFNDYGVVSRMNRFAKLVTTRKRMFRTMYSQWNFRGFKDAHHPETWNPDLRLVEEASVLHERDVALFPLLPRLGSRVAARLPPIARTARILRYQF